MELDEVRGALVQESRELLAGMEAALLAIEQNGVTSDIINAVFRAAHTIKGSAGLFALDLVVSFTHVLESVLERARNGRLVIDESMLTLLLACSDYIALLVNGIEAGKELEEPNPEMREWLLMQLHGYLEPQEQAVPSEPLVEVEQDAEPVLIRPSDGVLSPFWHISLRVTPDALRNGMDPLSFLRYLATVGRIIYVHTLSETLPPLAEMDPETCYLGFELEFDARIEQQAIEDVFEFIRDGSQVYVLPPHSPLSAYAQLLQALTDDPQLLGQIWLDAAALTAGEWRQLQGGGEVVQDEPIQELLPQVQGTAAVPVKAGDERRLQEQVFVKVEASKLDLLIDLVGELVIASASAKLVAKQCQHTLMEEATSNITGLVEQIRDASLNLRMVPIGEVFQRFPRVVRDICRDLGKQIELVISGADAELDKSMVDKLADPLMHIVRNAADHGIEPVEERRAAGKPEAGTLRLHAFHDAGSIVIEVSDDGRGLDRERIRAKAIERGLIHPEQTLADSEIYKQIFEPGFSTAEQVTNLSGRGVGMDVVKKNIEQLRGEVEIDSRPGRGAAVRIRLPLTLAIIDGFQVVVGDTTFVIPLELVVECIDLSEQDTLHNILNLRGRPLPFVRLRELFELPPPAQKIRENLVVVQYGHTLAGLVVDHLTGEFQAVIKPLGQLLRGVRGISGSTILGDGRVALILDIPHLVHRAGGGTRKGAGEELHRLLGNH